VISKDPSNPVTDIPTSLPNLPPAQTTAQNFNQRLLDLLKAFLVWIISIACLLVIPLVLVIPYVIYLSVSEMNTTPDSMLKDKTFIFLSILGVIPAHVLTLFGAWALQTNFGKTPFLKSLGFSWPSSLPPWLWTLFCALAAFVMLGMGALVTSLIGGGKTDLDLLIESSYQARLVTAVLAVFTAPLVEEVIYRGLLYPAIQRILGMGVAVAIVTLMFSAVHFYQYRNNIGVIVVITVLSLTLTLVRAFTDRLLPSVVIHMVFNGVQAVILVLEPYFKTPEAIPPPAIPALIQLIPFWF
jgi:uncharacterized protein